MANIELDGANKKIKVDSGDLTLDVPGDIILDADGADLVFADGGTNILKVTNSSSDVVLQPQVDAKDIKFNQYDGRTLLEVNDGGFVAIANGATGPGQLRLYEDTDNGTNYTALQVGTQSGDITYTLPTADGSNGQALTTNGSGTLSWATASSADPSSADGDSLGTASAEWSDLYLADGGIIYFGNDQEITLTHSADSGLLLKHTATADDKPINLVLQTGETDMAADDVIGKISWQAPDEGTGTDAILVSAAIQAVAEGNHSSSSNATRLEFHTGASELATSQMTISSGGIVGIGAVPTGDLGVGLHIKTADSGQGTAGGNADELVIEGSGDVGLSILSGNSSSGCIFFGDDGASDQGQIVYKHDDDYMMFRVNNGERMRLDSTGDLGIGITDPYGKLHVVGHGSGGWVSEMRISDDGSNSSGVLTMWNSNNTIDDNTEKFLNCQEQSTVRCIIYSDGDLQNHDNSYGSISDERIKQDIRDANSQWDDIKAFKVKNFKRKDDVRQYGDKAWEQIGLIAQEAEIVSPKIIKEVPPSIGDVESSSEFGTIENDTTKPIRDTEGNITGYEKKVVQKNTVKQIKYSILYMKAIKCLQEAQTRIETLETKVAALEG